MRGGCRLSVGTLPVFVMQPRHSVYATGKPHGHTLRIPADAGVIVMNVSTVAFLYRYMQTGMPLVTRRLTIDGNAVGEPKNVSTVIGTSFRELLEFCKTDIDSIKKLIAGGPMMGMSVPDIDMPVVKRIKENEIKYIINFFIIVTYFYFNFNIKRQNLLFCLLY